MDQQRLIFLLQRYHDGTLTNADAEELLSIIHDKTIENTLQSLGSTLENESFVPYVFKEGEVAARLKSILDIDKSDEEPIANNPGIVHRIHFLKTAWFRYAAAILLIIGIGAYLWNNYKPNPTTSAEASSAKVQEKDILPGGQKAVLTLADGSTIILDSAANGQLATQGSSKVIKSADGQLIYDHTRLDHRSSKSEDGSAINTMSTPRGGQYQLTLSDGTHVWLNAASSITYPTSFTENTREVKISGEAYFEIIPNKSKPFIVKTISDEITVLGTSFNVNAYPDESSIKTSLIDGSIKIKPVYIHRSSKRSEVDKTSAGETGNGYILKPGQAFVNNKIISTNLSQDVAWRNGKFNFDGLSLQQAMRMLGRWYDVEIIYEKGIPDIEIVGEIERSLTLAQLLDGLKDLDIHYRLDGRKLIIEP